MDQPLLQSVVKDAALVDPAVQAFFIPTIQVPQTLLVHVATEVVEWGHALPVTDLVIVNQVFTI